MKHHLSPTRRAFLRQASLLSLYGGATPFALNLAAMTSAVGQSSGGYRALIFLNMAGGNDSHNTVLATDATSFASYRQYRDTSATDGAASIALAQSSLLPITSANANGLNTGRTFALHPKLPKLQALFNNGRAAVVANVGPLIAPLTVDQYKAGSVPVPKDLFSHNNQTATWQAFAGEGSRYGWGGKLGDLLLTQNSGAIFTCISAGGNAVFLAGTKAVQLQVGAGGLPAVNGLVKNGATAPTVFDNYSGGAADTTTAALASLLTRTRADLFSQDLASITQRSIDAQTKFRQSLVPAYSAATPTGVAAPPAANGLAQQMQTVLRVMASASALGVARQVFYVNVGGFDTHDDQITRHEALMASLDDAIGYFDTTAQALGLGGSATLFTGSEFGRTFTTNGDGSDHGWGAHHFIVGGAVRGGDVYGRFPVLGVNNSDNVGSALLPALAVEQYAATLAKWLGVTNTSLDTVFPNLKNFNLRDLGFLTA